MPHISNCTDARHRRFKIATSGAQIILEQVLLVACQNIVTLNARILDSSNQPHTYYWDLISGPAVTWLEAQNQAMVTWQQPDASRPDRIFRFWLDRGTPFEIYQDMLVTGINREPMRAPNVTLSGATLQPWADASAVVPSTMFGQPAVEFSAATIVRVNPALRSIAWAPPTAEKLGDGISVRLLNAADGTSAEVFKVLFVSASSLQYANNLDVNNRYEFVPTYTARGMTAVTYHPRAYTFPRPAGTVEIAGMDPAEMSVTSGGLIITRSVIDRQLLSNAYTDTMEGSSVVGVMTASQSVISRSLVQVPNATDNQEGTHSVGVLYISRSVSASGGVVSVG